MTIHDMQNLNRATMGYISFIITPGMTLINVFDVNIGARKCYSNAGFIEESIVKDAFTYENEQWGRCHMVAVQ